MEHQDKINFDDIVLDDDDPEKTEDEVIKDLVMEELKGFFRPEFLNRIDEIVVFRKLTKPDIRDIASIMLNSLKERLLSKSYNLLLSDTVIEQILEEGFKFSGISSWLYFWIFISMKKIRSSTKV